MKKSFTFLAIVLTIISIQAAAQISCNPAFTASFVNANTVKFIPINLSDSAFTQHVWWFGDGTSSNLYSPTHSYNSGGVFVVKHKKTFLTPNGVFNCADSTTQTITIAGSVCNLNASFYVLNTVSNPLTQSFFNTSSNFSAGDSIRWNFGDGTVSYDLNPTHTYANAGIYNVCLRVKKNNSSPTMPPCISEYCKLDTVVAPTTCSLLASFSFYRDSIATSPNSYHFTNTSTSFAFSDSIRWTFGDGTSSNQINPIHNYAATGNYNVCLRIIKRAANGALTNCVSEVCYLLNVTPINTCNLQAYFSNITDSAIFNLVHFTNQSPGLAATDSVTWNFGDGTVSHDVSPNHAFANPGVYTVCVTIFRASAAGAIPCVRTFCKTVTITAACNLTANFNWYRDSSALSYYTYQFTNSSSPLGSTDSIRWTFGDGTSSNQPNPNHVYAQPGNYVVCLRVIKRNANGTLTTCVAEKCYTVTVSPICNVVAAFSFSASAINYKTINFINTTVTSGSSYSAIWNFGDGTTATGWNVSHTYATAGSYVVCLTVQFANCSNTKCNTVVVTAPPPACTQLANYGFVRSASNNNIVTFTPDYIDPTVQYTWTFGDGAGSLSPIATHSFSAIGYYTVCLTAFKNSNCASTVCKSIYVSSIANCSLNTAWFTTQPDSLVPNRITFLAQANNAILSQSWTIRKLPATAGTGIITINGTNPTYVFLDSGMYRVCLKASFAGGCIKEYCNDIHVAQNMPVGTSCNLQVYPNPATNMVNAAVTLAAPAPLFAYIYNSMNMLVAQKQQQGVVGTNTVSVNIANLPAGIYSYRLQYGNQVCSATFIK